MKYFRIGKTASNGTTLFILLSALAVWIPAVHAGDEASPIEVDPQPLAAALNSLSEQSGLQFAYVTTVANGVESPGTSGTSSPADALDSMLAGTGLTYSYINDTTVAIAAVEERDEDTEPGKLRPASSLVLMAQNQASAPRSQNNQTSPTNNDDDEAPLEIEEIIVTGSQIRGSGAAGANVITLDRQYIELGGFATTQEILRSIPQNSDVGESENTSAANFASGENVGFSSSVNLRGLGTESTLSLVNGRRSAPGGFVGGFVDLNFIPASAIERVEVLADGASAIYGSDAIAGVINVILRDDYDGAETRLRYAPGTSDIDEIQFSQVFGKSWDTGNVLLTYEYYDRSELKSADRTYTRNSDLTSFGGTDSSGPFSNPGNILGYTAADGTFVPTQLGIPTGQDGTALEATDLLDGVTNLQNVREGSTVLPSQEQHSAFLLLSQELSSTIDLFAEIRYNNRKFEHRGALIEFGNTFTVPNTNAFFIDLDPVGGSTDLRMTYSFGEDYGPQRIAGDVETSGSTLGATFALSNSWELEAYGSFSTSETQSRTNRFPNTALFALALADDNPATAFNLFGDGSNTNPATLAAIEGFNLAQMESELTVINVVADGYLFDLPGGAAKLAIGGEFRDQSLTRSRMSFSRTLEPVQETNAVEDFDLGRDVTATFAEVYLPLVSEQNKKPGIEQLTVSIAARYEDYSDFGDTLNPKFGVSWSPTDNLTFRSTFGTSFRAPFLTQLDDSQTSMFAFAGIPDPASATGSSTVLFRSGNSADVLPVEGTTWTAGFDIEPKSLPGFRVGLTYFATELDNEIDFPARNLLQPLLEPDNFAPIIARVPEDADLATVTELLNSCPFCGAFTADDIDVVVDNRLGNVNKSEVSGLDFGAAYVFHTDGGSSFNLTISASHLIDFERQVFGVSSFEDLLDTLSNPVSLKLRGGLSWNSGDGMHASIFGSHITDYTSDRGSVCSAEPQGCGVGSWTTWDFNLGYDFGERNSGLLGGVGVSLNVRNVFDTGPPFVDIPPLGIGYDPTNANPYGRYMTLQMTKDWW